MNTKPNHTTCHNPACRKDINRGDALLRSVSLEQVAFCSAACLTVFGELDAARRQPIPEQRRASVVRGRIGA